jgi:hypothetical protein
LLSDSDFGSAATPVRDNFSTENRTSALINGVQ